MGWSARDRALVAVAALAATAWALFPAAAPAVAGRGALVAVKIAAVAALALLALARRAAPGSAGLALALGAHALGDLLIEVGPLLAAMAAFGCGHLLYAALFARERRRVEEIGGGTKLLLGALALTAALVLARVTPGLAPPLAAAVPVYALALLAMASLAQLARRGRPWVPAGALAYVASDCLLALDLFAGPVAAARWLVWPLYWAGQAAIALGWLRRGA